MVASDTVLFIASLVILYVFYRIFIQTNASSTGDRNTSSSTARRHYVTLQQISKVVELFPHVPRHLIEIDLGRTGSVELTCENILSGTLSVPSDLTAAGMPSSSAERKDPSVSLLSFKGDVAAEMRLLASAKQEPLKKWEAEPTLREASLRNRKQFMLLQARQKYMEKRSTSNQSNTNGESDVMDGKTSADKTTA